MSSCEDDPLLAPQGGDSEDGGSYGNLSLPGEEDKDLSLNPETSVEKVLPILKLIDLVLIMSVNPGFGGQKFMKETLEKVKILRKEIDSQKYNTEIEIDGGINFENSKIAIEAGVNILVSGTTIFKENNGDLKKNIQLLKAG